MRPRRTLAALATATAVTATAIGVAPTAASAAPTDLFISEYVEGSSFNKAIELYNGTSADIDLAAGGYELALYFNGAATPSTPLKLSGTVAAGDVFVFAASSAAPAILAQADQTTGASLFNGDDAIVLTKGGTVLDSIGQIGVDPGSEWGTGATSTADNTLRRISSVTAGDTDPSDAFDPAAQWAGFAIDTLDGLGTHTADGGPVDQPATVKCGGTLTVEAGATATREVTATDPDDTITDLAVTAVTPAPASGSISRTAFIAAAGVGGTATATVTATGLPAGSYAVTLTATDADGGTATCTLTVQATTVLSVGEVQGPTRDDENGRTDRSPLAPASGNGTSSVLYDVRGVITQKSLLRSSSGADQYGFYLQSRKGTEDGDPLSSDGIFVFMGSFTTLIGGYAPTVGDEVVLRGRVSEYFNQTQLSSASLQRKLASGLDVDTAVQVDDARPPADAAAADLFWERHEGARLRVRAGSGVIAPRYVFSSTADSEIQVLDREDPLMQRTDPYARRVFRDAHPLDDIPGELFDNGNPQRILLGAGGVKATEGDSGALLPPVRTFDTLTEDAYGAISYAFSKYTVQPEQLTVTGGADPAANNPPQPANRDREVAVATYNVENLYDYRDDPFDGCDFAGNAGCTGVSPPFDYVPASEAEYTERLARQARQIVNLLHSPDLLMIQEAEDQDICSVADGKLVCGDTNNADGAPDTLQELALTIAVGGGPAYAAAYDRNGADDRGITSAFLYRTDRLTLAEATADHPVLGSAPSVEYRSAGLPFNADVQNPKALNAVLPADVDDSTGLDGTNVYTRAPQVGRFTLAAAPGSAEHYTLWAVSNHFSSGPDRRVGQRREQAAYGAALVQAIEASDSTARVIFGGDLNVFPRPDDPIATAANPTPSDQLGPLYQAGMHNLWDDLAAEVPAAAYSYTYQGQAQTLDNLFVNGKLHGDLVQIRSAHINADYSESVGDRGASDHDPSVARFRSRASMTVADASVVEGDKGDSDLTFTVTLSRPLSESVVICAATYGTTAQAGSDYDAYAGCRTLAAGQTSLDFPVTVRGDRRVEGNEQVKLFVTGVSGVQLTDPVAVGTISDDD